MRIDPSIAQVGIVVLIGALAVMAGLKNHWDVVGLALTGCLGALNLPPRGPTGSQQP
jgi:hypothetical protein